MRRASLGKFSAKQLRTELNLTVSKNIVINYSNANKILKYEKKLKVPALQEHHKFPESSGPKQCHQGEKIGPTKCFLMKKNQSR